MHDYKKKCKSVEEVIGVYHIFHFELLMKYQLFKPFWHYRGSPLPTKQRWENNMLL